MASIRSTALLAAVLCLQGCVRGREERLPEEQAGDAQIFADKRRDVEARLNDKLTGIEARFQGLRMNVTPGSVARPELERALQDGTQAAATARILLQQLTGSDRNNWEALRAQTEDSIKRADDIWSAFDRSRQR